MKVLACAIPVGSLLGRHAVEAAWFQDAWRAPLHRTEAPATDIFIAVFGHRPTWMKQIMIARNGVAFLFGLDVPTNAEIMRPQVRGSYRVGDKIGAWPIYALTDNELIAGRDNTHLDFRVSILKEGDCVVISTICTVHNLFGKLYLFCITPFHKLGVRLLISNAVEAGRL